MCVYLAKIGISLSLMSYVCYALSIFMYLTCYMIELLEMYMVYIHVIKSFILERIYRWRKFLILRGGVEVIRRYYIPLYTLKRSVYLE